MADSKKDDATTEAPAGDDELQVKPTDEMSKAELQEVLVNPDDVKLHPAPGDKGIEAEFGAQTEPERPPFSTARADVPSFRGSPPDPVRTRHPTRTSSTPRAGRSTRGPPKARSRR